MTPLELLKAARELISDPERWTRHELARTKDGIDVSPANPTAISWCAVGAIGKCIAVDNHSSISREAIRLLNNEAIETTDMEGISGVNDWCGHQATLAVFDRVIAKLEIQK